MHSENQDAAFGPSGSQHHVTPHSSQYQYVSLITVYAAQINDNGPVTLSYHSDPVRAEIASKGKSWYGSDGWSTPMPAIALPQHNGEVAIYLLASDTPIDLDNRLIEKMKRDKLAALSKLSTDEVKALRTLGIDPIKE